MALAVVVGFRSSDVDSPPPPFPLFQVFSVDCYVKDNFCVQVYAVSPGLFPRKKKLCELWHNTIMMSGEARRGSNNQPDQGGQAQAVEPANDVAPYILVTERLFLS